MSSRPGSVTWEPARVSEAPPAFSAAAASDIRATIRQHLDETGTRIVVVDDDPTGTQTVRDIPLLTSWQPEDLDWAFRAARPIYAVLTNSRATDEAIASQTNFELGRSLGQLSQRHRVPLRVISRSDSTLRGHFPAEPEALAQGLQQHQIDTDLVLICSAFPEAGRITLDDIHWVRRGPGFVPAAETEFASDSTFGYRSSDLRAWVREKAGGTPRVSSISITDIRRGGPTRIAEMLTTLAEDSRYVVANAVDSSDLDALALGAQLAEEGGVGLIYRTGPSFVSARAGLTVATPLGEEELPVGGGRGLLVVGSHTALTTRQLESASARHDFKIVWLDARALIGTNPDSRAQVVSATATELCSALGDGDAALVTSRAIRNGKGDMPNQQASRVVADALVQITQCVATVTPLEWLVAKGGITSHDIAAHALGARRATLLGQLFHGKVSVWALGDDSLQPGLKYVVFPGNVGDERTLGQTLDRLKGRP